MRFVFLALSSSLSELSLIELTLLCEARLPPKELQLFEHLLSRHAQVKIAYLWRFTIGDGVPRINIRNRWRKSDTLFERQRRDASFRFLLRCLRRLEEERLYRLDLIVLVKQARVI